jgi:hypothetical protein
MVSRRHSLLTRTLPREASSAVCTFSSSVKLAPGDSSHLTNELAGLFGLRFRLGLCWRTFLWHCLLLSLGRYVWPPGE